MLHVVSAPNVILSLTSDPSASLVAGGLQDTILNCSAMLDRFVNSGILQYTFAWQDKDGDAIVSDSRTIISPASSPSLTPYSTLSLSPLSTEDTNFTCTVAVSETQARLEASEQARNSLSLNVSSESAKP